MPTLPSVLFLTHALGGGGAERATVNLANHLAEAGWRVGLLPLQTAGHRYLIHPRVEIDDAIPQGGNRYIRGLRKLSYIGRAVRAFRPDVVVSFGAGFGYLASPTIRTRFRLITQIVTDPTYLMSRSRFDRITYRRAFAKSDLIVFQTHGAMSYYDESIQRKGKIILNPLRNGLTHNSSPFIERNKEIVSFGRLVPQKRFDVLIDAFALFHEAHTDYKLSIFGEGPLREDLASQIATLNLTASVTLDDFRDDIHDRIRNCAMYVLSSDVEGLPNAMLEAMAIGIPSVCTDCSPGGARETIDRFGSGLLTQAGDPATLAQAMIALVNDPARADELIAAGAPLGDLLTGHRIYEEWADVITEVAAR